MATALKARLSRHACGADVFGHHAELMLYGLKFSYGFTKLDAAVSKLKRQVKRLFHGASHHGGMQQCGQGMQGMRKLRWQALLVAHPPVQGGTQGGVHACGLPLGIGDSQHTQHTVALKQHMVSHHGVGHQRTDASAIRRRRRRGGKGQEAVWQGGARCHQQTCGHGLSDGQWRSIGSAQRCHGIELTQGQAAAPIALVCKQVEKAAAQDHVPQQLRRQPCFGRAHHCQGAVVLEHGFDGVCKHG